MFFLVTCYYHIFSFPSFFLKVVIFSSVSDQTLLLTCIYMVSMMLNYNVFKVIRPKGAWGSSKLHLFWAEYCNRTQTHISSSLTVNESERLAGTQGTYGGEGHTSEWFMEDMGKWSHLEKPWWQHISWHPGSNCQDTLIHMVPHSATQGILFHH